MPFMKDFKFRRKPNGSIEARYRKGGIEKSITRKNLGELDRLCREFIKSIQNKTPCGVNGSKRTFESFTKQWLEIVKKPNLNPRTLKSYERHCEKNIFPVLGKMAISQITPFDIQQLLNSFLEQGHGRTAEDVKMLLLQIFDSATNELRLKTNPMRSVKIPKHKRVSGIALTIEEENILLKALCGNIYEKVIKYLLYSGCRVHEARLLKYGDIDFKNSMITVHSKKGHGLKENEYLTRHIPLSKSLKEVLPSADEGLTAGKHIFIFSISAVEKTFKDILPNHHLHELRHTFATRCYEKGIPDRVYKTWLGHQSLDMSQHYTHIMTDFEQQQAKKLDDD